jgi:tRNA (guanine37-N1)-methyltransferase
MTGYDLLGNIAIIKSEGDNKKKSRNEKLREAKKILENPHIKSVFEKIGNVHGRLRTINIKHIAGERNLIAISKENNCVFKFNIKTCYFSSRLSGERKEIASMIKKNDCVLVMFAGVGVYPIVINKIAKPKKITGVELGRDCCKYFKENLKLNKMQGQIEIIQGDVKRKVNSKLGKFDVIVMARPNLRESFFKQGLLASKKTTRIFYYGFCNIDEKDKMIRGLISEAEKLKRKIKVINVVKAGDIAPYKYRYRIEIRVLN